MNLHENLIEDGLSYMVEVMKKEADFIVPIARRGIRVLELSPQSQKLFENGQILFYDSIRFHTREKLKKKKIMLFDEGVNTGKTLNEIEWELGKLSIEKGLDLKIYKSALFVNRDNAKYRPLYYPPRLLLNANSYDDFSLQLHHKMLSTGRPMDVDHLIHILKITEPSKFINTLHEKFYARKLGHSEIYDNVKMFTIDLDSDHLKSILSFYIPSIKGLPELFDVGPKKIRISIKNDIAYIVPVIIPAMEIGNNIFDLKTKCPIREILNDLSMCQTISNNIDDDVKSIICYNCITNALNMNLITEFLIKLKKYVDFEFQGIDAKSIQVIYRNGSKQLINKLEKKIKNCLECGEIIVINGEKAKKCNFESPIKEKVSLKDFIILKDPDNGDDASIRPEIVVATAVSKNLEINKTSLIKYGNKEKNFGISYSQIYDAIKDMETYKISEGIDVGLDTGYLKPIMPYHGIDISCENKIYNAIVRLYAPASNEVDTSLKCLLRLITCRG